MTLPPPEMLAAPSAACAADGPASRSEKRQQVRILPILFVLIIGLEFPFFPLLQKVFPIFSRFGWSRPTIAGVETILAQATIAVVILLVVHSWERLPMRSVGIVQFAASDLVLGLAAFGMLLFLEGILPSLLMTATAFRGWGFSGMDTRQLTLIDQIRWPVMLAVAISAGIYEELWARGYGVERLEALTHSTLAAAAITLTLDLGAHVPFWGFRYALLIAPGQMLLLGLYLWRRRLMPCVIAHILWDFGRPILLALMWLLATLHPMHATWRW